MLLPSTSNTGAGGPPAQDSSGGRPPACPGILPGDLLLMVEVEAPHGSAFCVKMAWRPGSCGGGPRGRAPVACRARSDGGGGAEDAEEEDDKVIGRAAGEDPHRGMERGRRR